MRFTFVFCVDELVECIKVGGCSAVDVVPPVADKVLLVENGSVGAQKAVFRQTTVGIRGTDVKDLTFSLGIGVVTCNFYIWF